MRRHNRLPVIVFRDSSTRVAHLKNCPSDWDVKKFGIFLDDGLLFTYNTFPSSNRSVATPHYDKHTLLAWSKQANSKLDMPDCLSPLFAWRCSVKHDDSYDLCGHFCGGGSHVNSIFLLLHFFEIYNNFVCSNCFSLLHKPFFSCVQMPHLIMLSKRQSSTTALHLKT